MAEPKYVDSRKRGRLLAFSVFTGVMLFVIRAWDLVDIRSNLGLLTLGLGYFFFAYLGQIALFNFSVTKKSLLTVLPQTALFITTGALFVMLFFFNDFERLIEIVLLISLLSVMIMSTYSSLLMSNVFNVATFKSIPLVQVALTASFIVTVMTVYFVSVSVVNAGMDPILMGVLLFVIYTIIFIFHYVHMEMDVKEIMTLSGTTGFICTFAFMTVFFMGQGFELSALVPASIAYAGVGLEMVVKKATNRGFVIFQYILVILVAFIINIIFNR